MQQHIAWKQGLNRTGFKITGIRVERHRAGRGAKRVYQCLISKHLVV
jgi:hypothetical protein